MDAVRNEYERFFVWLAEQDASSDVRKLANLVHAKINELAPLGTTHSARSKALARFAQQLDEYTDHLPNPDAGRRLTEIPWVRLKRLSVGPFRGFTHQENFDLDKRLVLIYGPNGTGKSSLCEALEYSLLGSAVEAAEKRISHANYYANVLVGGFEPPQLVASSEQGNELPVVANDEAYRFCFIEKNRIEDFSRLAAKQPAERARLIATLFGVEQFDQFVNGFNEQIDVQLDLVGVNRVALDSRRLAIREDTAVIDRLAEKNQALDAEEVLLANRFEDGLSFAGLVERVGTLNHPGRLQEVTGLIEAPRPEVVLASAGSVREGYEQMSSDFAALEALQQELNQRQEDISYEHLYSAVLEIEEQSPNACPACETPSDETRRDPYVKARAGIAALAELATLQARKRERAESFRERSASVKQEFDLIAAFAANKKNDDSIQIALRDVRPQPEAAWWTPLSDKNGEEQSVVEKIFLMAEEVDKHNGEVEGYTVALGILRVERELLQSYRDSITVQNAKREDLAHIVASARERIEQFNQDNAQLSASADADVPIVAMNIRMRDAYDSYLALLRDYRSGLPATLLEGLNTTAMELYNAFNRDDHAVDKLVELSLPINPNERIEIAFADRPAVFVDALQVLSEGHLRCLGLSILVAKNIRLNCPFLLFDDVVNAIDDDHRNGICKTLFEDSWLQRKQIVLTCHGEEFIKTIQRDIGAAAARDECVLYVFKPHEGDKRLNIDAAPRSRNYVILARQSLNNLEIREALTQSRKALEGINVRLWKWLGSRGIGELTLRVKAPGAAYELRNQTEAIEKSLRSDQFVHAKKQNLLTALRELLGVQAGSLEWSYLNSGTHEADRGEFDRGVVTTIVLAIEALDTELST